jgi:hypothetical protein
VTKQQVEVVSGPTWPGTIFTRTVDSMQVSWWDCHVFMESLVQQANCGPIPWPGTPSWCDMPDDDPRKLLALAGFGVYQALSVDAWQEASAEASSAISAGQDWGEVSRSMRRHGNTGRNARGGKNLPAHKPFKKPIKEPSR